MHIYKNTYGLYALANSTACSMIGCWHHNIVCLSVCLSVMLCIVAKQYIHPTAKVSEQVNRKCRARNTTVQFSTPHSDPDLSIMFTWCTCSPCDFVYILFI